MRRRSLTIFTVIGGYFSWVSDIWIHNGRSPDLIHLSDLFPHSVNTCDPSRFTQQNLGPPHSSRSRGPFSVLKRGSEPGSRQKRSPGACVAKLVETERGTKLGLRE